jgi:hypothetical protein
MSTTARFGYDYVFELATQLLPEEQMRLVQKMNKLILEREAESGENMDERKEIQWIEYTIPGKPIVSAAEIEEIKRQVNDRRPMDTPEERERARHELREILLNCPVMTDEELKGFEEARREINECHLAYL